MLIKPTPERLIVTPTDFGKEGKISFVTQTYILLTARRQQFYSTLYANDLVRITAASSLYRVKNSVGPVW